MKEIERFGQVVKPKIDPVEDLIGCVKTQPIDIEKQLDESVEENDSEHMAQLGDKRI